MSWKAIDFQGIISLDTPIIDLLDQYLNGKEDQLTRRILHILSIRQKQPKDESTVDLKLTDGVDILSKKMTHFADELEASGETIDWQKSSQLLNETIWHYVQTIENCITELFQQLEQLTLEQWHNRLAFVVSAVKEILLYKMETLIWGIKRLENTIKKSRKDQESSVYAFFDRLSSPWKTVLDKTLIPHLEKNQESLNLQYNKFLNRYEAYLSLLENLDKEFEKFTKFEVFASLESEQRKHFLKLYELLKLWEYNRSAKVLPAREFVVAMRNEASVDKASQLFRSYYKALRKSLFRKSLAIKNLHHYFLKAVFEEGNPEKIFEQHNQELITNEIQSCQDEAKLLALTIHQYREFLLKADPDPYVRTRLGFSDLTSAPEPAQLKPLLNLGFEVESLNDLFEHLLQSVKKPKALQKEIAQIHPIIQEYLHEMGQPLATYRVMRTYGEKVLDQMKQLDELGTSEYEVVDYTGHLLNRLLRVDWKYNVLQGIPLFHDLYQIHQGFLIPIEDWQHIARSQKFQKLLEKIQDSLKSKKNLNPFHDIELDMNDIKGYLQDFYAYVQRATSEFKTYSVQAEDLYKDLSQQLLEYRYLFSGFFYQLRQNESEGAFIRKQLLFVDQYFDSVELKLDELINLPAQQES